MATVASQLVSANRKYGPLVALITKNIVTRGTVSSFHASRDNVNFNYEVNEIYTPLDRIKHNLLYILSMFAPEARGVRIFDQMQPQLKAFVEQIFSSYEENKRFWARSTFAFFYEPYTRLDSEWYFGNPLAGQFVNPQILANFKAKADLVPWIARTVDRYLKEEARIKTVFLNFAERQAETKRVMEGIFLGQMSGWENLGLNAIDYMYPETPFSPFEAIKRIWDGLAIVPDNLQDIQDWMIGARPRPDISSIKSPWVILQRATDWHEEEWERRQEEERKKNIATYAGGGVENIVPVMKIGEFLFYELTKKEQLEYESACMRHCIGWESQPYCARMLAGKGRAFAIYREGDPIQGRCSGQTPAATMYFDKQQEVYAGSFWDPDDMKKYWWDLNQIHGFKNRKLIEPSDARIRKAAAIFILSQGYTQRGWLDAEYNALKPNFDPQRAYGLDGMRRRRW